MCVLISSYKFISNIFHCKKKQKDVIINVKYPFFLSDINGH
jgi:hypothetical protein